MMQGALSIWLESERVVGMPKSYIHVFHLEDSLMKYIDCTNDSIDMDYPIPVIQLVPLPEQE